MEPGGQPDQHDLEAACLHQIHPETHLVQHLDPGGLEVGQVTSVVDVVVGIEVGEPHRDGGEMGHQPRG
jgi:hypothetical protein